MARSWLPDPQSQLQLIFEYANGIDSSEIDAVNLHRAIDRAGPTVTIVKARTAYDANPRVIGGYNPYNWKNWRGRYERNPGKFIFDLNREMKWDRQEPRRGFVSRSPQTYGLVFGDGDLQINPDLKGGSAQNRTFAYPPQTSALVGQAGDFLVEQIRVYKVLRGAASQAAPPLPLSANISSRSSSPPAFQVPDASGTLLQLGIGVSLIVALLRLRSMRIDSFDATVTEPGASMKKRSLSQGTA